MADEVSDRLAVFTIAAQVDPGSWVLDIGCGDGHRLTKLRAVREIEAVGIDLAPPAGDEGVKLSAYDGWTVPFEDKTFDHALIGYVLHHLTRDHAQHIVEEAVRVARKSVIVLEDSMPEFDLFYRLRNKFHRMESDLDYEAQSYRFKSPKSEDMFLTHAQWVSFFEGVPGVRGVALQALTNVYRYSHHTLLRVNVA